MKKRTEKPIYVTEPFLPPLEEFTPYLEKIWESKWLTNNGPYHQQLEQALCEHLGVNHLALFVNGTAALITALQTLQITGEVITTPYSFVATAHSLLWNNIKPVFVDIDPVTMNLDPNHIESAITSQTTAILPVHCYGNPCNVDRIQQIAAKHKLKVIYDGAHAFDVKYRGESLLVHGDLSVLSFHATKVFNTFEGGAIICPDAKTKQRVDYLKNFGFADEVTIVAAGINGKMNELQAAFGLLQLNHIGHAIRSRKKIDCRYREALSGVSGITCMAEPGVTVRNYAYFPVLVGADYPLTREELYQKLKGQGIYSRRYFYPLISNMPMYSELASANVGNLPKANSVAESVLCLPIFPALENSEQQRIIDVIWNPE